jgi:hypothetical protein
MVDRRRPVGPLDLPGAGGATAPGSWAPPPGLLVVVRRPGSVRQPGGLVLGGKGEQRL